MTATYTKAETIITKTIVTLATVPPGFCNRT